MTTTVATLENLRERVIKDLDQLHIPEEVKDEVRIHVEKKPKKTKKVKPAPEAIDINRPVLEEAEFKRKVNEAVKDNRSGLDSYKTFKSREYNSAKHWKTYSSLSDDDKRSFFDLK